MSLMFGGVLFLGKVWGKIRPMVELTDDEGVEYHAGISHSYKKGMVSIKQDDLDSPSNFQVDVEAYVGLCNKSQMKLKFGELGETSEELDQKILQENAKLQQKMKKRG